MATAKGDRGIFATKPVDRLVEDTHEKEHELRRAVGALDLTALGLGAIIGTGIFVIIGEAITTSGPSIILAFLLAGVTCAFSALAFAELASSIPVSGSAYTYSYATLGELAAWIIGWDLILEYGVSIAAVAVGWGQYFNELLDSLFGLSLPESIANPPGEGGAVNVPAAFLVLAVTAVLMIGVRETARANTIMVAIKLIVLALFIALGITAFTVGQLLAVLRRGRGLLGDGDRGVADLLRLHRLRRRLDVGRGGQGARARPAAARSSARSRSRRRSTSSSPSSPPARCRSTSSRAPRRRSRPCSTRAPGISWGADVISFGALVAITSVVLTLLYGQSRILFAMSRDGLLPRARLARQPAHAHARVHHRRARARVRRARRGRPAHRDRRAGQHRHAVRVRGREHRRDHPAPHAARPRARLPRAVRAGLPADRHRAVHLPDGRPARAPPGCGS